MVTALPAPATRAGAALRRLRRDPSICGRMSRTARCSPPGNRFRSREAARPDRVERPLARRTPQTPAAPSPDGLRPRPCASSFSTSTGAARRRTGAIRRSRRRPRPVPSPCSMSTTRPPRTLTFISSSPYAVHRAAGTRASAHRRGGPSANPTAVADGQHVTVQHDATLEQQARAIHSEYKLFVVANSPFSTYVMPGAAVLTHAFGLAADRPRHIGNAGLAKRADLPLDAAMPAPTCSSALGPSWTCPFSREPRPAARMIARMKCPRFHRYAAAGARQPRPAS